MHRQNLGVWLEQVFQWWSMWVHQKLGIHHRRILLNPQWSLYFSQVIFINSEAIVFRGIWEGIGFGFHSSIRVLEEVLIHKVYSWFLWPGRYTIPVFFTWVNRSSPPCSSRVGGVTRCFPCGIPSPLHTRDVPISTRQNCSMNSEFNRSIVHFGVEVFFIFIETTWNFGVEILNILGIVSNLFTQRHALISSSQMAGHSNVDKAAWLHYQPTIIKCYGWSRYMWSGDLHNHFLALKPVYTSEDLGLQQVGYSCSKVTGYKDVSLRMLVPMDTTIITFTLGIGGDHIETGMV